jgi:hypothetical protein
MSVCTKCLLTERAAVFHMHQPNRKYKLLDFISLSERRVYEGSSKFTLTLPVIRLFHSAVLLLCLANAGTDCCTNHLRWTTAIAKLPLLQSSTYRKPPSLPSTSYKHSRKLPLSTSDKHKRKWPQNFRLPHYEHGLS